MLVSEAAGVLNLKVRFVPGITKEYSKCRVKVILTAQGETADSYIEGVVKKLRKVITDVAVATSDLAEQQVVFARGAARLSAKDLYQDIKRSKRCWIPKAKPTATNANAAPGAKNRWLS